jgi:predicted DNA-binding transcriptional regulator
VKKTLNLQDVIGTIKTVETMIHTTNSELIAHNPVLSKSKNKDTESKERMKKYKLLLKQLNILKKAKDRANRKGLKFFGLFGRTNQDNIFELDILKRTKSTLEEMYNSKSKEKPERVTFQITKKEIMEELEQVEKDIKNIKQSMTKFNNSTTVKVKIFKELNLL